MVNFLINVIVFFLSTCVSCHSYAAAASNSPVVNIGGWGKARGSLYSLLGLPVNVFLGILFARPPRKDLRFQPPKTTPTPWSGIKNFTKPSNWCIQPKGSILVIARDAVFAEDCLYLNVYTPGNVTSSSKPAVMVWIHGGGFYLGSGFEHDGAMLASRHQMVVVNFNFRLGVLGFLNIPGTTITGNYGLLDQVAALQWVRYNIEPFGGDPEMVTIFGESAGGRSVSLHGLSPLSQGLFKRAISESGSATQYLAVVPTGFDIQPAVKEFGAGLGCHSSRELLECLKSKSFDEILSHQKKLYEQLIPGQLSPLAIPNVDNHFITVHPLETIRQGKFDKLPINTVEYLIGFNLDEGTIFAPNPPVTKEEFQNVIMTTTKMGYPMACLEKLHAVLFHWYADWKANNTTPFRWFKSTSEFLSDFIFKVPIVEFANEWTLTNRTVYLYRFTHELKYPKLPHVGVAHLMEIAFVFGKPFYPDMHPGKTRHLAINFTDTDKMVSSKMMKMWAEFAKNGSPGFDWPTYTQTNKKYLNIALENKVEETWKPETTALWTELVDKLVDRTQGIPRESQPRDEL